ncbi:MAG: hypothetical protein LBH37_04800 [Oscillospiraceae bacterium]|nr:hypothetical protein [Oscillospiraceae bacterium]
MARAKNSGGATNVDVSEEVRVKAVSTKGTAIGTGYGFKIKAASAEGTTIGRGKNSSGTANINVNKEAGVKAVSTEGAAIAPTMVLKIRRQALSLREMMTRRKVRRGQAPSPVKAALQALTLK